MFQKIHIYFAAFLCLVSAVNSNITLGFDEVIKNCTVSESDQRQGVCISFEKKLINCPPLNKLLIEKNFTALRATFCDGPDSVKDINWVKVCCPLDEYRPELEQDHTDHPNYHLLPHSICGSNAVDGRIVGGSDVVPGQLPWMVRIGMKQDDEVQFTCGGSIISSRYIMTAGHCFKDQSATLSLVRLGETDADNDGEECVELDSNTKVCGQTEDYEHEDLIVHPEYDGRAGSQSDIALIRLDREIQNLTSYFIRPICLPFAKEFKLPPVQNTTTLSVLKQINVAGWGKLRNSDSEGSPKLQFLPVPLRPNFYCSNAYKPNNITITEKQLCAGGDVGKGSCAGDSGSPLSYYTRAGKSPLRAYQIGIVSFGKSRCADGKAPVVYTRVAKYLSWILDHIKK